MVMSFMVDICDNRNALGLTDVIVEMTLWLIDVIVVMTFEVDRCDNGNSIGVDSCDSGNV